jgi:hypothetical protein
MPVGESGHSADHGFGEDVEARGGAWHVKRENGSEGAGAVQRIDRSDTADGAALRDGPATEPSVGW